MSNEQRHAVFSKAELRQSKPDRNAFSQVSRLPIMVVLDGVRQAYNIGAMFRLCDALLAERLVICGSDFQLRKRRLTQAAQGTQYWTPWSHEASAEQVVRDAKAAGYQIVAVELAAGSVPPEQLVAKFPVCLVLGGEHDGVSQEVLNLADAVVEIPMRGMANSINVSTAAAIVLYRISGQAEAAAAKAP